MYKRQSFASRIRDIVDVPEFIMRFDISKNNVIVAVGPVWHGDVIGYVRVNFVGAD